MEIEKAVSGDGMNSPFVSGGVRRDVSRNATGKARASSARGLINTENVIWEGVFNSTPVSSYNYPAGVGGAPGGPLEFDLSRVVPTGLENSPQTFSIALWRRVS
jgi:hypothetical protein